MNFNYAFYFYGVPALLEGDICNTDANFILLSFRRYFETVDKNILALNGIKSNLIDPNSDMLLQTKLDFL